MGLHLWKERLNPSSSTMTVKVHMSGINALFGMSMGFVIGGFIHWYFPNNGNGDSAFMPGYMITYAAAFVFMGWSIFEHFRFVRHVTGQTTAALKLMLALILSCTVLEICSCIWCLAQPDLYTRDIIDEYEPDSSSPTCVDVAFAAEMAWYFFYGIFSCVAAKWL